MNFFPLVYRCCVAVKPKPPMVAWINKTVPAHPVSLEEAREDSNAYLIPDFEDEADIEGSIEKYLKSNYRDIFLYELAGWYLDEKTYPNMTYPLFHEWFEISIHTMVLDMVKGPIAKE